MSEKDPKDKAENIPSSSPVCYAGMDGMRPGFQTGEPGTKRAEYSKPDRPAKIPLIFTEAWMNRDADHLASLFDAKAEFVNVVGLWWHSRADIQKAHDYGLRIIFDRSKLEVLETRERYLTDSIAVVHAKMKLTGQTNPDDTDGVTGGTRINVFTFVVRCEKQNWICVAAHNTEVIPGTETFVKTSSGISKPVNYHKH